MLELEGSQVGRYLLKDFLGRGGMAEVYRAQDSVLERSVAIKLILPAFASDEDFLDRFIREAQLVASLDHPHVVPVYDYGEEDGRPFLVMPYLPGGSLATRLAGQPVALVRAALWLYQLGSALDAAHAAGVLHRDVKPANVLLGQDDRLLLSDFGIARALESSTRLTATGVLVGTPSFMAPELAEGEAADAASDRYALGVLAFQLLTGETPFAGESALAVLHQHVNTPVPEVTQKNPELPLELNRVVQRALAKDPLERPRTGVELARELASALPQDLRAELPSAVSLLTAPTPEAGLGETAATLVKGDLENAPTIQESPPLAPPMASSPRPPGKGRRILTVALVLTGVVAGALLMRLWPRSEEPEPEMIGLAQEEVSRPGDSNGPGTETETALSVPAAEGQDENPDESPSPTLEEPDPAEADPRADGAANKVEGFREKPPGPAPASMPRLQRPPRRLTREDFSGWAQHPEVKEARQNQILRVYGEGGLAYLEGDGRRALEALEKLGEAARRQPHLSHSWPFTFLRLKEEPEPWEVALVYGDPRNEARGLLRIELQQSPRDLKLRLGLAFVEHLDGNHERAREMLSQLYDRGSRGQRRAVGSFRVAQLVALEHLDLMQIPEAVVWAIKGMDPGAGPFVQEMIMRLREAGASGEVREGFLRQACEKGVPAACEALRNER